MSIRKEIRKRWQPRKADAHKGDFGRLFILAGSRGLTGAAYLASLGALRAGAGLITLGVPESIYPILARRHAEVMVRPFPCTQSGELSFAARKPLLEFLSNQDVFALGPGLSQNPNTQKLIRELLQKSSQPLVIDADALNALTDNLEVLKHCCYRAVLTPHPGEFSRLFGKVDRSDAARRQKAADVAKKYRIHLVLKGHRTVVASPEGKIYVNQTGNPGMASGGTGDVLTGVIAALLAQGFSLWEASRFGVFLHGLAGDLAAKEIGQISLTAGDLLDFLPAAIQKTAK